MAKKTELEDVSLDMTPMIDVVFLLIIFFILMPPKEMEGKLESSLPSQGSSNPPPEEQEPPVTFSLNLTAQAKGEDEISTVVKFNNAVVCEFTTLSISALDKIYDSPEKDDILGKEYDRDKKQFSHDSAQIRSLIGKMTTAAEGAPDGKDTDILIDADSKVPFKIVLAMLNAGAGAEFPNLKFTQPSSSIWNKD